MTTRTGTNRRGFLGRLGTIFGGLLAAPATGLGPGRSARADDTTLWRQLYALRARGYGVNGVGLPPFVWTSSLRRKLRHDTTFRRQFSLTFGGPAAPPVYIAPAPAPGYGYSYEYGYPYGATGYAQPIPGTPAYAPQAYARPTYTQPTYAAPTYAPPSYGAPRYAAPAPTYTPAPPPAGRVPAPTVLPAPLSAPGGVELPPPLPVPYSSPVSRRGRFLGDVLSLLEA